MAHALVDVDTFTAALTVPDDGDAHSAASITTPLQAAANRTLYLRNRLPGAAASIVVPFAPRLRLNLGSRFSDGSATGPILCLVNSDVTDAGGAYCWLDNMPAAGTITLATACVTGLATAGAHGGLVGTAPTVSLYRYTVSTGASVLVVSTADPHATTSLVLYEADHLITSVACAEAISSDRLYYMLVTGEFGANKAANKFAVYGFKLTITP